MYAPQYNVFDIITYVYIYIYGDTTLDARCMYAPRYNVFDIIT